MTNTNHVTNTPRSSPHSQRRKVVTNAPVESSGATAAGSESRTPKRRSRPVNRTSELTTPASSHKRSKTEALIVKEELQWNMEEGRPQKSKQRKTIRQEEAQDEIQEENSFEERTSANKINRKQEIKEEEAEIQVDRVTPRKAKSRGNAQTKESELEDGGPSPKKTKRRFTETEEEEAVDRDLSPEKTKRKKSVKEEEVKKGEGEEGQKKIKRRRKTKEEKEAEAMPLASRTSGLHMFVGAHVSCAKGVHNAVTNCIHIGGNAFAMFLKSQRKWENPPLQDDHRDQFISFCRDHKYDATSHVLPHGSYLVNLAQEEAEKATQGYNAFLDDLHRCEALSIKLYNFHPGSTGSHSRPSAIARIANALNRAHQATNTVTPVLETMAGGGNIVGSTFEDLRDIIALVEDKKRIGVCLDTCHVFAAGYDLRTPTAFKKTFNQFDEIVGMKYLRALHLNDSKAPFGSHRDLHQNIGLGFLGLRAFHNVMNEPRFEGLPMVLETPIDRKDPETGKDVEDKGVWAREIKMLEALIGADADGEEFKALERKLADEGAGERKKLQEVFDRKVEKDRKALEKGQTKLSFGGKKKKEKEVDEESDNEV